MHEDENLLIFSLLIYWATLILLAFKSKNRKRIIAINLSIHLIYSTFFLYQLLYASAHGAALVWWFYLLMSITIHWFINTIQLIHLLLRKKHNQ